VSAASRTAAKKLLPQAMTSIAQSSISIASRCHPPHAWRELYRQRETRPCAALHTKEADHSKRARGSAVQEMGVIRDPDGPAKTVF